MSQIPNFNSLVAMSLDVRKPVFALTKDDANQRGNVWETTSVNIAQFHEKYARLAQTVIGLHRRLMSAPHLEAYRQNCGWADGLGQLYLALRPQVTKALDLSDILRAELVFSVSAFDAFIHDMVLTGMGEIFDNARPRTVSFRQLRKNAAERFACPLGALTREQFLFHIQDRNQLISFQSVNSIASAIRSINEVQVWDLVAAKRGISRETLERQFLLIVERRHVIVHQADMLPVLGGFRNAIDHSQVAKSQMFLTELASNIAEVALPPIEALIAGVPVEGAQQELEESGA